MQGSTDSTAGTSKQIPIGSQVDTLINLYGHILTGSNNHWVVGHYQNSNNYALAYLSPTTNSMFLTSSFTNKSFEIVVEYTK